MEEQPTRSGGLAGALAWLVGASILLAWLPLVGPALAGWLAARRACGTGTRIGIGALSAGLWLGGLLLLAARDVHVGATEVSLGPLRLLAGAYAAAGLCGALVAAGGFTRLVGAVGLLAAALSMGMQGRLVWSFIEQLRPAPITRDAAPMACPDNLKKLYNALMIYSDSWDGVLPPGDRWMTAIKDNVEKDSWLRCPAFASQGYGYAINAAAAGKALSAIKDRAGTPLVYDSSERGRDAHDAVSTLPKPGRHGGKNNVVYVDGHLGTLP